MSNGQDPSEARGAMLGIPDAVARAASQLVQQALARVISSELRVTSAAQGRLLLAEDDDTEELADTIQRFVGVATPVVRVAARGARFTRVPWVLVASSAASIGVTVRAGVRELQVIAAFLVWRFEQETGAPPDQALLQKLTVELYLSPKRAPDVGDLRLPFVRLARRWIMSGALGRDTRRSATKALEAVERLDVTAVAARARARSVAR